MARIFVSYRRKTSKEFAEKIARYLRRMFRPTRVFFDADSIEPGSVWSQEIERHLTECEVFIAVIDQEWNPETPDNEGKPYRLFEESDWVHRELRLALQQNQLHRENLRIAPVLIVQALIGNRVRSPTRAQLPEVLHGICDFQSQKCEGDVNAMMPFLGALSEQIHKYFGDPPTGEFGFRFWRQMPSGYNAYEYEYRYRIPSLVQDLEPFVTLSHCEGDIHESHPDLTVEGRWELYKNWCQWTAKEHGLPWFDPANCMNAFMLLERRSKTDTIWRTIAVSIILPLNDCGYSLLMNPPKHQHVSALSLSEVDLVRGPSKYLLLDTLIVAKRDPMSRKSPREVDNRWGAWLSIRHLAEYWTPQESETVTLLVEPDSIKLVPLLKGLRFSEKRRNKHCAPILYFNLHQNAGQESAQDSTDDAQYQKHIKNLLLNFHIWKESTPVVRDNPTSRE